MNQKLSDLKIDKNWKIFLKLPENLLKIFKENLMEVKFSPGQKISSFNELIPGIFLIIEGKVRLIGKGKEDELFTLDTFIEKQIFGVESILNCNKNHYYSASYETKCQFLPLNIFNEILKNKTDFIENFNYLKSFEIYECLARINDPDLPSNRELVNWSKFLCNQKIKVYHHYQNQKLSINKTNNIYLISSNNKNHEIGSLLKDKNAFEISGSLPIRYIKLKDKLQTTLYKKYLKNNISSEKITDKQVQNIKEDKTEQLKALEDMYGSLPSSIKYPEERGKGILLETLACIRMLSIFFDLPFRKDVIHKILAEQINKSSEEFLIVEQIAAIIDFVGLRSTFLEPNSKDLLERIQLPALILIKNQSSILWEINDGIFIQSDPVRGQRKISSKEIFNLAKEDSVKILTIEKNIYTPKSRFGLSWFIPALKKHKSSLIQVVIASFFVQLLGVFNPLLIQQIIDAVINQGNLKSLNVLGTLLIAMALAQALLSSLRMYLFSDTTNRIDLSLGGTIIRHLLRLPLRYFSSRPVGEVSSRVSELEKIRKFLTGTALTALLDALFAVIYIVVMLLYSVKLTIFALGVVPFFIGLTLVVSPIIRKQLRDQAEANAKVNSHLVETISGMETVKGQGMELQSEWRWSKLYSSQVQAGFRNIVTSTAASSANNFLQQLSGLLIIWVGALLVLEGEMTVGQLIAFRILSGYVTSPLLRMASLWQNFQETSISLERLSDIINNKEEIEIAGEDLPPLPKIKGNLKYDGINFRFKNKGPLQLLNISFEISEGTFVGIVGSSGSGKSTLVKLLTRLFEPLDGTIRVDDNDISKVDLYSLRSNIGVVPQESLLFEGTIQFNISLTKPEATFEEITNAAKIACAHDFIQELPSGYSTHLGEKGSGLSGGQRQRIAIARMILKDPNLLVLDEATSALDVDTERKLINNLREKFKDKTVLFITHRLTSLRNTSKILVMHQGTLQEQGSHEELMLLDGRYANLYKQQDIN